MFGIMREKRLIATYPGIMIDIAGFCHPDNRMNKKVGLVFLDSAKSQFIMRPVHRVSGLKGDDLSPSETRKFIS